MRIPGFLILILALAISLRAAEVIGPISHAPQQPKPGQEILVTAGITEADGLGGVSLLYQVVQPGKYIQIGDPEFKTQWTQAAMKDDGTNGDAVAGDQIFSVRLASPQFQHRSLVRYRVEAAGRAGKKVSKPSLEDAVPNLAFFVYDEMPPYRAAIEPGSSVSSRGQVKEFGPEVLNSLPVYHLISKKKSVEDSTWIERYPGDEYKWKGTLVYAGKVYDHIRYRARGGDWRYAMGKNMWKFDFNRGQGFEAADNYGLTYKTKWSKLNLGACIQQGDYGFRGEQGMFDALSYRLFNLAGVEAPRTHWIHFRIIDEKEEARSQYDGDFWGLYLAVEQVNGGYLKEHNLPDGNLYKMKQGRGELQNKGETGVEDGSDLTAFIRGYRSAKDEKWWSENVDLDRYYSYRAVVEGVHHYDIGEGMGKNYNFFFNPKTSRWSMLPWDVDLTWADSMFGNGDSPFKRRVLRIPRFNLQYQNRVREFRDLLFNEEQMARLLHEHAAIIARFAGADRAIWDYHPALRKFAFASKGGNGRFYQAVPDHSFAGMVRYMKEYVQHRSEFLDMIAADAGVPAKPLITLDGENKLKLKPEVSPAMGSSVEWRLGESAVASAKSPGIYEIETVWKRQTTGEAAVKLPSNQLKPGSQYRARARILDSSGRAGHWSEPVLVGRE